MLKIAILGAGNISLSHMEAWLKIPEAAVVAACDIRSERTHLAWEMTQCREYQDFETMMAHEQPDIVDICLPTYLHTEYAVKAMKQGAHVLCEKPLSLHEEDIIRCYRTAQETGRCFMIAQVLRFWGEYEQLKHAYDSGNYGALISATMTRLGKAPKSSWEQWMLDEGKSGLTPFDLHIHDLDFLIYAFGPPQTIDCHRAKGQGRDDIHVIYGYNGFFVSCQAAWFDCPYTFQCGYRFQFERALMEYQAGHLRVFHQDGKIETPGLDSATFQDGTVPTTNAYLNEIRYFCDCVLSQQPCEKVKEKELIAVLRTIRQLT